MKTKLAEQLEEILRSVTTNDKKGGERTMKIGATVKIKKCNQIAEVAGENGEVVDVQIQEFDKYAVYPLWVKMTSGERKGKIFGFRYDEVEILPTRPL